MNSSLEMMNTEMEALAKRFPGAQLPPNCFTSMNAEFVDYESRTKLTVSIPVRKELLNPMAVMQGGFITAAFDNTFGPLSYLAARYPCSTLDLHTNYIRSVAEGDLLTITATVVSRGPSSMHLSAEAMNSKGKLVATCTSHMIVIKTP